MTLPAEELRWDRRVGAPSRGGGTPIIGRSPALVRAVALARKFAPTPLPILLVGATGAGKELFAQSIHTWSGCRGALVDLNCGALPKAMVESLLFGHRRGAFTGAVEGVEGLVAAAEGGTLFLDEVASLSRAAQAKLLRVLETGEVRRLGETAKRCVRFRVLVAAQEDLEARVRRGKFRHDLYQRVAGVVLRLPALAERREDLWGLAQHFAGAQGLDLAAEAGAVIAHYDWPGNVRELKLAVERAACLAEGGVIEAAAMAEAIELVAPRGAWGVGVGSRGSGDTRGAALASLLAKHRGDVHATAQELGVSRSTLYRWLVECGVEPPLRGRYRLAGTDTKSHEIP